MDYDVQCIFTGFYNMVTLTLQLIPTNCGTCIYLWSLFNFTPDSLHMLKV